MEVCEELSLEIKKTKQNKNWLFLCHLMFCWRPTAPTSASHLWTLTMQRWIQTVALWWVVTSAGTNAELPAETQKVSLSERHRRRNRRSSDRARELIPRSECCDFWHSAVNISPRHTAPWWKCSTTEASEFAEPCALTGDGPAARHRAREAAAVTPRQEDRTVLHGEPAHPHQAAQGPRPDLRGQVQGEALRWKQRDACVDKPPRLLLQALLWWNEQRLADWEQWLVGKLAKCRLWATVELFKLT